MSAPALPSDAVSLLREGVLTQAARLARAGDLDGAAALLTDNGASTPEDLHSLHLLARIRAQQGAWLEAERLWERTLAIDPQFVGAQDGLARLRQQRRGRGWAGAALALAMLGLAGATAYAVAYMSSRTTSAQIEALRAELAAQQQSSAREANERLSAVQDELRGYSESVKAGLDEESRRDAALRRRLNAVNDELKRINTTLEQDAEASPEAPRAARE